MKKIYLVSISILLLMNACQKEVAQVANQSTPKTTGIKNSSTIQGVSLIKDGFPYPNISTSSSMIGDEIGWFLDISALQNNLSGTSVLASKNSLNGTYCGSGVKTVTMYAGQNIAMGTLQYANDGTNLYIEYNTDADWYMSEIHLYVGSLASSPKSGGGTPSPGRFPIKSTFNASNLSQSITYTIPLSGALTGGFIIAAHASVLRVDIDGDVIAKETAWAAGTRFTSNKNWATYVVASLESCGGGTGDFTGNQTTNK